MNITYHAQKKSVFYFPLFFLLALFFFFQSWRIAKDEQESVLRGEVTPTVSLNVEVKGVLISMPTDIPKTEEEQIKEALIKELYLDPEAIRITFFESDSKYATVGAEVAGTEIGDEVWFAVNTENGWQIIGNDREGVNCEILKKYSDFPVELLPECFDKVLDQLIKRQPVE